MKKFLNDQRGMTMVEVMMGFTILVILMGALSGVMAFASHMLENSVDLRNAEETFQSYVYKKEPDSAASRVANAVRLYNDADGSSVDITTNLYVLDSSDVLTEQVEKDSLDVKVCFFKK